MRRFVLGWKKLGLEQSLGTRLVTYADDLVILCRRGSAESRTLARWQGRCAYSFDQGQRSFELELEDSNYGQPGAKEMGCRETGFINSKWPLKMVQKMVHKGGTHS
jgi:RNA-directed DNA polymerase